MPQLHEFQGKHDPNINWSQNMNTAANVELTPAELQMIQARREEEDAKRKKQEAEEALRQEKLRKKQEAETKAINTLKAGLLKADTTNIIKRDEYDNLYFMYGSQKQAIDIKEHVVYDTSSWRYSGTTRGFKINLCGPYNDYKNRWYKKPESALKAIKECQEQLSAKVAMEQRKRSLSERTIELLEEQYPEAKVTFREGFEGSYRMKSRQDTYDVETERGRVTFRSMFDVDQNIHLRVESYYVSKSDVQQDVLNLILK